jgi:signal transduction histidine kinase
MTARRQLASHLAQAERLDSVGKLAGHIAHDFNNLLTAIIGNAEIALRQLDPTDRAAADVAKIMDVASRVFADETAAIVRPPAVDHCARHRCEGIH